MTNTPTPYTSPSSVWDPATEGDKLAALAALATLPSRPTSSATIDRGAYMIALEGTYRQGLSEAVRAILKGSLQHAFFPSPPEFRMEHDRQMESYYARDRRVRPNNMEFLRDDAHKPTPQTEESRARVSAIYAAFCADYEAEGERQTPDQFRMKYGLTQEQFDAMQPVETPDAMKRIGER